MTKAREELLAKGWRPSKDRLPDPYRQPLDHPKIKKYLSVRTRRALAWNGIQHVLPLLALDRVKALELLDGIGVVSVAQIEALQEQYTLELSYWSQYGGGIPRGIEIVRKRRRLVPGGGNAKSEPSRKGSEGSRRMR